MTRARLCLRYTLCIGLAIVAALSLVLWPSHRRSAAPMVETTASPDAVVATVLLYRDGEAKLADVRLIRGFCWVAWYQHIEQILLRPNNQADDPPFHYLWTLSGSGTVDHERDGRWFDATCLDPADLAAEDPVLERLRGSAILAR